MLKPALINKYPTAPLVVLDQHLTQQTNLHLTNGECISARALSAEMDQLTDSLAVGWKIDSLKACLKDTLEKLNDASVNNS